jgi:hypothetical protein
MVKMSTVWDRTAEFLSDNIGTILPIALLAFFVPASIEGNFQAAMRDAGLSLIVALRLVQLAFAVLSVWGSLTLVAMALDLADGSTAGIVARNRLLPALAVSITLAAAALVLVLPIPGILAATGYDLMGIARGDDVSLSGAAATMIAAYGLVLMAFFLWIGARLIVTTPVIVREKRMFGALRQSWKLTRGSTLRIIGVMLLFALVAWVSMLAANLVFGSVFALVTGGGADGVTLAGVLTSIAVAAVQTGFTVLVPAFTAKLYLALTADAGFRGSAAIA